LLRHLVALMLVVVTACAPPQSPRQSVDTAGPTASEATDLAIGEVHSVAITPATALLTKPGDARQLTAIAFDADGEQVSARGGEWRVSDDTVVSVGTQGVLTALASAGSAQVFYEVDGVRSAPMLVVVAAVVDGAILVSDDQVEVLHAVDETASTIGPGFEYEVRWLTPPPSVGELVVGVGEAPVGGEVVAVHDDVVTLALVDLEVLFDDLRFDEVLDLGAPEIIEDVFADFDVSYDEQGQPIFSAKSQAQRSAIPSNTVQIGGFECSYRGENVPAFEIQLSDFQPRGHVALHPVADSNGLRKLEFVGGMDMSAEAVVIARAGLKSTVVCEREFMWKYFPFPGPIGAVLSSVVRMGLGFEVEGETVAADFAVDVKAGVAGSTTFGLEKASDDTWDIYSDANLQLSDNTAQLRPVILDPALHLGTELEVYGFAKAAIAPTFIRTAGFEVLKLKAGLVAVTDLRTPESQAEDPTYASSGDLGFLVVLEAGAGFQAAGGWFSFNPAKLKLTLVDLPIAQTPTGTLQAPAFVASPTASVPLQIDLDPATMSPTLFGITGVALYELELDGTTLLSATEVGRVMSSTPDQTRFTVDWIPPASFADRPVTLAAFSLSDLGDLPLEISDDSTIRVAVGDDLGVQSAIAVTGRDIWTGGLAVLDYDLSSATQRRFSGPGGVIATDSGARFVAKDPYRMWMLLTAQDGWLSVISVRRGYEMEIDHDADSTTTDVYATSPGMTRYPTGPEPRGVATAHLQPLAIVATEDGLELIDTTFYERILVVPNSQLGVDPLSERLYHVAISSDDRHVFVSVTPRVGRRAGRVMKLDLASLTFIPSILYNRTVCDGDNVMALEIAPDDSNVAVGCPLLDVAGQLRPGVLVIRASDGDNALHLTEFGDGILRGPLSFFPSGDVSSLAWSHDSGSVYVGHTNGHNSLISHGVVRRCVLAEDTCRHEVAVEGAVRSVGVTGVAGAEVVYAADAQGFVTRLDDDLFEPGPQTTGQEIIVDSWGSFPSADGTGGCLVDLGSHMEAVSCTDTWADPWMEQPAGSMLVF